MKKKRKGKKIYSFSSLSRPDEFLLQVKEEAIKSNLYLCQAENNFDLGLKSHHGGRVIYRASVSVDENGGSVIQGTIETIPWHTRPAKKPTLWNKILSVIAYIVAIPIILIALLVAAITYLVIRIIHGKSEEINEEKILCNFMTNKMCCTRENNE